MKAQLADTFEPVRSDLRNLRIMGEAWCAEMKALHALMLECATKGDIRRLEAEIAGLSERVSNLEAVVQSQSMELRRNTEDIRSSEPRSRSYDCNSIDAIFVPRSSSGALPRSRSESASRGRLLAWSFVGSFF